MKKLLLAVAVIIAIGVAVRFLPLADWLHTFQMYVRGLGAAGYVLYALVYAACIVLLIPASLLSIGAGAIFGVLAGSIVVASGAVVGAIAAFLLARTVLRDRVAAMTARNPKLHAIDAAVEREGTRLMLLMRLSGFPPFTWINYALGLTAVPLTSYVVTTVVGILPGVIAFTYAGAAGAEALSGGGRRVALIVTALGAIAVSAYIARIATRAIKSDMLPARTEDSHG